MTGSEKGVRQKTLRSDIGSWEGRIISGTFWAEYNILMFNGTRVGGGGGGALEARVVPFTSMGVVI